MKPFGKGLFAFSFQVTIFVYLFMTIPPLLHSLFCFQKYFQKNESENKYNCTRYEENGTSACAVSFFLWLRKFIFIADSLQIKVICPIAV